MNKQELIKKLKELLTTPSELEGYDFDDGYDFGIEHAITLAKDLDDPVRPPEPKPLEIEKPVVPQCVADWYEEHKGNFEDGVYDLFVDFYEYEFRRNLSTDLVEWFELDDNKPIETLVKMKLFGYEVEKENLYTVEIPIANSPLGYHYVLRKTISGEIIIDSFFTNNWGNYDYCQLTEKEIKKYHEWAWKYAKEVKE